MTFIRTVEEDAAEGAVADMYGSARADFGYLPNMTRLFSHRPEVMSAWEQLLGAVRANMDPRRYEIATLGAARELGSSYCMLAHGVVVMGQGMASETLRAVAEGREAEVLSPQEAAVVAFAALVARAAGAVTRTDVDGLKAHGLSDAEVFDVAAAAAARCFFSKVLDAMGARPDSAYAAMAPELRAALTVGRPIETHR